MARSVRICLTSFASLSGLHFFRITWAAVALSSRRTPLGIRTLDWGALRLVVDGSWVGADAGRA